MHAIDSKAISKALAEVWTFDVRKFLEISSKAEETSSTKVTQIGGVMQVDQDYFKADPEKVRESQRLLLMDKSSEVYRQLPLHSCADSIGENIECEVRLSGAQELKDPAKWVKAEFRGDYFEVGKVFVEVSYVRENDLKLHLIQNSKEIQAQAQIPYGRRSSGGSKQNGSMFAALAGSNESNPTVERRNRGYSDTLYQGLSGLANRASQLFGGKGSSNKGSDDKNNI